MDLEEKVFTLPPPLPSPFPLPLGVLAGRSDLIIHHHHHHHTRVCMIWMDPWFNDAFWKTTKSIAGRREKAREGSRSERKNRLCRFHIYTYIRTGPLSVCWTWIMSEWVSELMWLMWLMWLMKWWCGDVVMWWWWWWWWFWWWWGTAIEDTSMWCVFWLETQSVRALQLQIAERRLNLSRSQQPGHSATYNTPFHYLSRMQRIYPLKQWIVVIRRPCHTYDGRSRGICDTVVAGPF